MTGLVESSAGALNLIAADVSPGSIDPLPFESNETVYVPPVAFRIWSI
jgi:hypothetical protein